MSAVSQLLVGDTLEQNEVVRQEQLIFNFAGGAESHLQEAAESASLPRPPPSAIFDGIDVAPRRN